ncbi:MAG TPA: PASTA domain-containing protein [Candidatus Eremiobacteraceae bacterium]|nr:PASTA domain-containing protein [Candidatus Eremiobacteraceae bacterium]
MSDSGPEAPRGGRRTAKLRAERALKAGKRVLGNRPWYFYAFWSALAVSAIIVVWLIVTWNAFIAPAGAPVTVPALIGLQFQAAQNLAAKSRVSLHIVARRTDFKAPKDRILGQLPAAGEQVREGRSVDVIVSDGVPTVKVPNVGAMSLRDATVALENAHLFPGTIGSRLQNDVTAGTVLDQKPDAFASLPAGSHVDLVVARGRPQRYAPNFVGASAAFASAAAKDAGIALDKITELPIAVGAKPKGTVVAQDPSAGSPLLPNQRISLQLSGGAPPTPVPIATSSPFGPSPSASPSAASPRPSVSGVLPSPQGARGMRVSVALPGSQAPAHIRVVLLDATGSRTLYDQRTTGGFTLSFDVTVTGAATIDTYVDDALVNSTAL